MGTLETMAEVSDLRLSAVDRWKDEDQTGGSGKGRSDKSKKIKTKVGN